MWLYLSFFLFFHVIQLPFQIFCILQVFVRWFTVLLSLQLFTSSSSFNCSLTSHGLECSIFLIFFVIVALVLDEYIELKLFCIIHETNFSLWLMTNHWRFINFFSFVSCLSTTLDGKECCYAIKVDGFSIEEEKRNSVKTFFLLLLVMAWVCAAELLSGYGV